MITSGFAFDERRLNLLAKHEVHTAVSIDGARESNDKIRGKGAYDKALFALKKLSENGLLDCVVTTMTKYNINDMAHPAEVAAEHHARMVVYHNLVPVGRAARTCLTLLRRRRNTSLPSTRYTTCRWLTRQTQSQRLRPILRPHRAPEEPC